ncbi:hypothetical protein [Halomonas denitrificans]|nr:hypothetical protein [Halomonas denitrificans]
MTEHDQQTATSPDPDDRPKDGAGKGYVEHVRDVLTRPDTFFDGSHRSGNTNAMIDLGGFLGVFFLATIVSRTFGYTGFDFEFGHLLDGIKAVLVIGIPIGALVFAWNALGKTRGLDFYLEKFGGALVLSTLLLLLALVLDVLDIRIQSWFRGLAMVFVYIGVFAITYAHAVPGKLKSAAAFTAAFYILYRLLGLLF